MFHRILAPNVYCHIKKIRAVVSCKALYRYIDRSDLYYFFYPGNQPLIHDIVPILSYCYLLLIVST